MPTPTTTEAAIRSNMVALITALTPTSLSGDPFRMSRYETPTFREWANGGDAAVFREFEISQYGTELISVTDTNIERRKAEFEVVVAYPHHWGLYAAADSGDTRHNRASLQAVLEQDVSSIARAIGVQGASGYLSGQGGTIEQQWGAEEGEGVTFGILPLTLEYYKDVS